MKWLSVFLCCLMCNENRALTKEATPKQWIDPDYNLTSTLEVKDKSQAFIDEIYRACESHLPSTDDIASGGNHMNPFNNCVHSQLNNQQKKTEALKEELSRGRDSIPVREKPSQGRELLSEYLSKRFREKVTGEKGQEKQVNHALFFDLYHSHLSKVAVVAINDYCTHGMSTEEKNQLLNNAERAERFLTNCAGKISTTCHKGEDGARKQRACQAMFSLRSINRAINITEEKIKFARCRGDYANTHRCKNRIGFDSQQEHYNPQEKGKTVDDITSLTSSEFQKHVLDKMKKTCPENEAPDEKCLKMLQVNALEQQGAEGKKEDDRKILAEFQIQTLVVAEKIKKQNSPKDIQRELALDGGNLEDVVSNVEEMSDREVNEIKNEIENRYLRERQAILQEVARRFKKNETPQENPSAQKIAEEVLQRGEDLKHLLFFNNVITGYLGVTKKNEEGEDELIGRNPSSLERELSGGLESVDIEDDFRESLQQYLADIKGSSKDEQVNPVLESEDVYKGILRDQDAYSEKLQNNSKQPPRQLP